MDSFNRLMRVLGWTVGPDWQYTPAGLQAKRTFLWARAGLGVMLAMIPIAAVADAIWGPTGRVTVAIVAAVPLALVFAMMCYHCAGYYIEKAREVLLRRRGLHLPATVGRHHSARDYAMSLAVIAAIIAGYVLTHHH